jgi:hypothetical protein
MSDDITVIPEGKKPVPDLDKFLRKETVSEAKIRQDRLKALQEIEDNKDGKYVPEQVLRWKTLGLQRPEFVTLADWRNCDEELNPLKRFVCHCTAVLMKPADIAKMTGCSVAFVNQVIKSQVGQAEVARIQDEVYSGKFTKVYEQIVPMAIQTAMEAMLDKNVKASTRVEAAFRFMDRALGKPKQAIEVEDNVARGILERLDQMAKERSVKTVDIDRDTMEALTAGGASNTIENKSQPDEIDEWIEGNL